MKSQNPIWPIIGAVAVTGASVGRADESTPFPTHEGVPSGVWLASDAPRAVRPVRPTKLYWRKSVTHVQVNIDASGNNIFGDAANEPSIAVDPTAPNRLVIGWRQFESVSSNFREAGWAYSWDGGRSWAFPGSIEPGVFRSDPVVEADAEGTFYYQGVTSVDGDLTCHVFRSDDGGVTWGDAVFAYGGDKPWFVIDKTDSEGRGHAYLAWASPNSRFVRSTDGGLSFEDPVAAPSWFGYGQLEVGKDGTLYAAGGGYSVVCNFMRSSNAKLAGEPVEFELHTQAPMGGRFSYGLDDSPNPGGLLGQAYVGVDRSEGPTADNLYALASVDPDGDDPLDVMFIRSEDRGVTWSDPIRVNDDPIDANNWQWFGTMSVAPNGRIDVVWNDTRNTGEAHLSQLFYAYSADGGESWSPNQAISGVFDSRIGGPDQRKLGDYYDMTSDLVGADLAWANTFNGEHDVYYTRIGEYDCNGNGVADTEDIASLTSDDCNFNGIPDECELAAGTAVDQDGDGILDQCQGCSGDVDGDGDTDQSDLGLLLVSYEKLPGDPLFNPDADLNGDGEVGQPDLGLLLADYECGA